MTDTRVKKGERKDDAFQRMCIAVEEFEERAAVLLASPSHTSSSSNHKSDPAVMSQRNGRIYQLYVEIEHERTRVLQQMEKDEDDSVAQSVLKELEKVRASLRLETRHTTYAPPLREKNDTASTMTSFLVLFQHHCTTLFVTVPRLCLMLYTVFLGSILLLLFVPLRWTHPVLRRCFQVRNNQLPMDLLVRLYARCVCTTGGIIVTRQQQDGIVEAGTPNQHQYDDTGPKNTNPTLVMFSHVSNLDPFCVMVSSSPIYCKFVGKAQLFLVPLFGWMGYAIGTQPISRNNRTKAVHDLRSLQEKLDKYQRSIAISPEGTRSKSGLLLEFKKGPFYLWQDCNHFYHTEESSGVACGVGSNINSNSNSNSSGGTSEGNTTTGSAACVPATNETVVTITPALIFGAYELWPPEAFFPVSGRVIVRYCHPIRVHPKEDDATDDDNKDVNHNEDNETTEETTTSETKTTDENTASEDGNGTTKSAAELLRDTARTRTRTVMLQEFTRNYPSEIAGLPLWSLPAPELLVFGLEYIAILIGLYYCTHLIRMVWSTITTTIVVLFWNTKDNTYAEVVTSYNGNRVGITLVVVVMIDIAMYVCVIK